MRICRGMSRESMSAFSGATFGALLHPARTATSAPPTIRKHALYVMLSSVRRRVRQPRLIPPGRILNRTVEGCNTGQKRPPCRSRLFRRWVRDNSRGVGCHAQVPGLPGRGHVERGPTRVHHARARLKASLGMAPARSPFPPMLSRTLRRLLRPRKLDTPSADRYYTRRYERYAAGHPAGRDGRPWRAGGSRSRRIAGRHPSLGHCAEGCRRSGP